MDKYKIIVITLSVLLVGIFAMGFFYNYGLKYNGWRIRSSSLTVVIEAKV